MDRQVARAPAGSRQERLRSLRAGQAMLLGAVVLGLLTAVLNTATGVLGERMGVAFGVLWLGVGYAGLRQRRYVRRLLAHSER